MPFTEIQRDLEIVILNKVSQTEREISYDITFSRNLKNNETNECITKQNVLQNRLTDLENELVVNGGRLGERDN